MEVIRFKNTDGLTHNNIVKAMKEMIDRERSKNFPSFNNNEYYWKIGFDVLRRLKDTNPDLRHSSEIDEILSIKVRRVLYHLDNYSEIWLIKDVNDCAPIMVASRGSGKTNMQLKYLEEMMRKWNRGIINNNQSIKNVIFNDPATIIFWSDGTKTVVKAENESFDPEKGLAMAIAKKSLGNRGSYYDEFKKWLPKDKTKWKDPAEKVCSSCKYFSLSPSSSRICLECLKDETLPNWEKKDIPSEKNTESETKSCSECKYADMPLFQDPCLHCYANNKIKWEKADE